MQRAIPPKPFRHLRPRPRLTTLIIGFRCSQATVLVSDSKITDAEGGEPTYATKISIPLQGTAFMLGAAGYTDLFHEFNRKIPLVVDRRLREYQIENIKKMVDTGLTHDDAVEYVLKGSLRLSQAEAPPPIEDAKVQEKPKADLPLTYYYTAENFLDDCKGLIRQITEQAETDSPFPLEALAVIYRPEWKSALLHYIDSRGRESTIDFWRPIGSGSPYVKMFFDRLYRFDRPAAELVSLAIFTIAFTQKIAKDPFVGYSKEFPPQVCLVLPDGRCGTYTIKNMDTILADVDRQLKEYETQIGSFSPSTIE